MDTAQSTFQNQVRFLLLPTLNPHEDHRTHRQKEIRELLAQIRPSTHSTHPHKDKGKCSVVFIWGVP